MGSSSKKKKEKKKDFQKPKLKVGKARPKSENQTDTSFKAKAIVLNQQSLNVSAPTISHQFQHHVSLLSSRSDSQRKDSLSYLTTFVASQPVNSVLPMPVGNFLDKVCPLILDGSTPVRSQIIKLLTGFQVDDLRDHAAKMLPFVRAGMTHLSKEIRVSSIDLLSWLLNSIGDAVVSCSGGWQKTLESFVTLLGWRQFGDDRKWSSGKATFGNESKTTARLMQVLDQFLKTGMGQGHLDGNNSNGSVAFSTFPIWFPKSHSLPETSDAYVSLNLFGTTQSTDHQILEDQVDRVRVFNEHYRSFVVYGISTAKNEGGELGRAAGQLAKTLKQTESLG